jgi:hypothetical protein
MIVYSINERDQQSFRYESKRKKRHTILVKYSPSLVVELKLLLFHTIQILIWYSNVALQKVYLLW